MLKLKGFQRIRAMDGDGVSVQFHIPSRVDPCNWFHGFSHNLLQPGAAPTMPGGDLWIPDKSLRAAWATVKHVKETLKELICISLSLTLSFSDSPPIKLPPTSSFHFIRGTVVGKRDS